MSFVGCKAGLAGMVLLLASVTGHARAPGITDLPVYQPHPWEKLLNVNDGLLAQQAPAPATPPAAPDAAAPGATQAPAPDDDVLPDLSGEPPEEDFSVGEIPAIETVELTPDSARKAIDAYVLVREKYKDAALENYENLQDFVEQDAKGREFEADIKAFGFLTVNDWNVAITTVGFAYSNHLEDQTVDIRQQIEEVKADTEMAQDMRDRMVQALTAMIPSDNNRTILSAMMTDTTYAEKLKQLETEEE